MPKGNPHSILPGESKAAAIRRLWSTSTLDHQAIAEVLGVSKNYVYAQVWRGAKPNYHRDWMARKRRKDPAYYAAEVERQLRKRRGQRHGV